MTTQAADHDLAVLDAPALAAMVGVGADQLPPACVVALRAADLRHRVLAEPDQQQALAMALAAIAAGQLAPSGPHRIGDWEKGWTENLREFEQGGCAMQSLIPKYNRHQVLRLCGRYVRASDPGFEYAAYTALREYCFQRHFAGCRRVVEFGCGTGTSLLLLAERLPHLELVGCDWAAASQQILMRLAARTGGRLQARRFDMFAPDPTLLLGPGTGVLTSAAMEQLGGDHAAFVDYLLAQQPAICLHLEPLCELYDEGDPFDAVALAYHRHRNYLTGFLPRLWRLEQQGCIELLEVRRTGLGSFFHEGYGLVAWRPRPAAAPR